MSVRASLYVQPETMVDRGSPPAAFRPGGNVALTTLTLSCGIREGKLMYSQKRNGHRQQGHMEFMAGDPDLDRLQTPVTQVCDASLTDLLSDFYARFDALKDSTTTQ